MRQLRPENSVPKGCPIKKGPAVCTGTSIYVWHMGRWGDKPQGWLNPVIGHPTRQLEVGGAEQQNSLRAALCPLRPAFPTHHSDGSFATTSHTNTPSAPRVWPATPAESSAAAVVPDPPTLDAAT